MLDTTVIRTQRLILRPWKDEDLPLFAALNADPRVMEFFPSILTRQESDQLAKRMQSKIKGKGWGFWAISVPGVAEFIGFIGLNSVNKSCSTPAAEIAWRLSYDFWGKGYATEGALACLKYGFETLHLKEIIAFTGEENLRSRAIMEKIGMKCDAIQENLQDGCKSGEPLLYKISA